MRIKNLVYTLLYIVALSFFTSCSQGYRYHIGVSQCVGGKWREKVNSEMLSAQHLYGNEVKVSIANAKGDSKKQVEQIDSLSSIGVDLIVVAPNEYEAVTPAIERAVKKGIPVVLFDRKVDTDNYTAYIGGDNVEAGRAMGHYALSILRERSYDHSPRILEMTGDMESSPAIDRHNGFSSVMKGNKDVNYSFIKTDWTPEDNYNKVREYLKSNLPPDILFCHSDLAAQYAYKAAKELGKEKSIRFLGIDGLPGKDEGIEAVEKGVLAGSYIYPTHGEEIVKLSLDILQGKKYDRENIMKSVIVTPDNAPIMQQTSMEMMRQSQDLLTLQGKLENYFGLYNAQRTAIIATVVLIILLLIVLVLVWRIVIVVRHANRREKELNKEQTLFYTNARHQLRTPLTLIDGPIKELAKSKDLKDRDRSLVDILLRNVEQLSRIVYDVLEFKPQSQSLSGEQNDVSVSDSNASVQQGRVEYLAQEDSEDLATVLIVDDNADMRRYLRTLLTDRYYVVEADDGESGLKVARDSVPDLIVSDVMMPVMDGLQFCRKIKDDSMTSHIPVILLTARSTEEQQVEGLGSGADAYMTKPFSAQLLIARIDNLLKSRAQLRHLFDGKSSEEDKEEMKLATPDREFINRLKNVITNRMAENNLKMDDIGSDLGISRIQLYRKVKALTGISPVDLLKQMRLQKAMSLLQHTDHTVSEIAYAVGFSSPGYFSTCFKKQFDKYPTDVRG